MRIAPGVFYQEQLAEKQSELAALQQRIKRLGSFRLFVGTGIIVLIFLLFRDQLPGGWISLAVVIAGFLTLVRRHTQLEEQERQTSIYIQLFQQELAALGGDISAFRPGDEYIDAAHPYSYDLDFFGKRSVYQMLCRSATEDGALRLADLLRQPYSAKAVLLSRQEIVTALSGKPEFLVDFRVAGASFLETKGDTTRINAWLTMPDEFVNKIFLRVVAIVVPLIVAGLAVLAIIGYTVMPLLTMLFVFNWIVLGTKAKAIKQSAFYVARSAKLIEKYEQLLRVIGDTSFKTTNWQAESEKAVEGIAKFRKLVSVFEGRYNLMVGPLMNSVFMFDIQCCLRLERWRRQHHEIISRALEQVTETDQHVSLATCAFNHPEHVYPAFDEGSSVYEAKEMIHPLLQQKAVGNDFSIGREEQFYLLTGANMTGKSTFIRTLGVNLILSYCGLPLRATTASLPLLRLFTAMRITDSVQDDISYFRAELNRIREIMQQAGSSESNYMILLDEPLRGTNTTDKQNGTRSIIEKLLGLKAIGIVATHDTVLCHLEEQYQGQVANYHFESSLAGNELLFDYKLKAGCSSSNNATILMKQLGIV